MKITGIIAEYNPFHNGHKYHIEQARKITDADYCIAVMSGDFVQRGEPAFYSKYLRTHMALLCGADLVLELPNIFSVSSAEDFSACGVQLLDRLGSVDFLCFGSEDGRVAPIEAAARILCKETPEFSEKLREGTSLGLSWPQARNRALLSLAEEQTDFPIKKEALNGLLGSPNNLLGIEYCKALLRLNSSIRPVTIKRQGQGYHDTGLTGSQASASALRAALTGTIPDTLLRHIPSELLPLYSQGHALYADDCSQLLNYALLTLLNQEAESLTRFADISPELAGRLSRQQFMWGSWDERIRQLKTKQYTYTRISRALTHLLLGITKEQVTAARDAGFAPYARILGFRREAAPLLSRLKESSSIPLMTKTADAARLLDGTALCMFRQDIYATHVRQSLESRKYAVSLKNEYNQPICII